MTHGNKGDLKTWKLIGLDQEPMDIDQYIMNREKILLETEMALKNIWSIILPALPPDRRLKVLKELGEGYEDQLYALEQEMANQA